MPPDANTVPSQLLRLGASVRPLLLDTGVSEAPVGVCGTCFLCAYGSQMFVVTTAHQLGGAHSGMVRILPATGAPTRLTLSQGIGRPDDDPADDVDLVAFPAASSGLTRPQLRKARLIDLTRGQAAQWSATAPVAGFLVLGYPREVARVDYGRERVHVSLASIPGAYAGPRHGSQVVHTIRVENTLQFADFAGFSGAPVFTVEHHVGAGPVFRFCGVAFAGTPQAGTMDFVEAESVVSLLQDALAHVRRFGTRWPSAIRE